ncbi:homoserine dehydrogenase [Parvularcula lutaonensis]|uniref:Homoserine dehydrogenase n=1 Tax=Parvularcula lutaonensis TaxID=491923 RepID=A0ABV7MEP0_9PROT|nr:homoserine dehydrogenase [Parvularcula lutaonensis]GGY55188.1 homoserine dehydrogenase [Parvularcula lutaonensis]
MSQLRLAIAGLGTVGTGLIQITDEDRFSDMLQVISVSARSRDRERDVDISRFEWFDDPVAMASADGTDVFIELMGGEDGVAKAAIEAALHAGKHVVTANKALIAKHGLALARLAEEKGVALRFEAAVAGGVPVIRGLRDGLSGSKVTKLQGVLNGTCNFILAAMEEGRTYDDTLAEAQRIGFAEADPSFDVDGIDAAQKLAILGALAFGAMPSLDQIAPKGISTVSPEDLAAAKTLGLRMKLVAVLRRDGQGLAARVAPALVPLTSALDIGGGGENIVVADSDPLGRVAFSGPGAGRGPTAAACVADLVTISRGSTGPVFARPTGTIDQSPDVSPDAEPVPHFLRFEVEDVPGVLASLADILAKENISVETIRQSPADNGASRVEVVITTHEAPTAALLEAARHAESLDHVLSRPSVYPILREDT